VRHLWLALPFLLVAMVGAAAAVVASPARPERVSVAVADVAPGTALRVPLPHPDPFGRRAVWVVRLAADRWAALSPANPWNGPGRVPSPCDLTWDAATRRLSDDCATARLWADGRRIGGPAPHNMWGYPVCLDGATIVVTLARPTIVAPSGAPRPACDGG
jgi:hypothetical protein